MRSFLHTALLVFFLLPNISALFAQTSEVQIQAHILGQHAVREVTLSEVADHRIILDGPVSSVSIRLPEGTGLAGAFIMDSDGHKYRLLQDPDAPEVAFLQTQLVIFRQAVHEFTLHSAGMRGQAQVHLLYAEPLPVESYGSLYKDGGLPCERPVTVTQEVWRLGLKEPSVYPTQTEVEHVVIHHTATPNSDTDYVKTMRNIYLYHTEVNGWDDVGYNFLIAPDGTIFEGRDGQDVYDDDNVKGAHFCGKNSNTMGISMIGTYTDTVPSDTAFSSLRQLIAWKLNREKLKPLDSSLHPVGAMDAALLGVVVGHRDGCATECPGDSLYARIPALKREIDKIMEDCAPYASLGADPALFQAVKIYPVPAQERLYIKGLEPIPGAVSYRILDLQGRELASGRVP